MAEDAGAGDPAGRAAQRPPLGIRRKGIDAAEGGPDLRRPAQLGSRRAGREHLLSFNPKPLDEAAGFWRYLRPDDAERCVDDDRARARPLAAGARGQGLDLGRDLVGRGRGFLGRLHGQPADRDVGPAVAVQVRQHGGLVAEVRAGKIITIETTVYRVATTLLHTDELMHALIELVIAYGVEV